VGLYVANKAKPGSLGALVVTNRLFDAFTETVAVGVHVPPVTLNIPRAVWANVTLLYVPPLIRTVTDALVIVKLIDVPVPKVPAFIVIVPALAATLLENVGVPPIIPPS
jgi:hypothetical protein